MPNGPLDVQIVRLGRARNRPDAGERVRWSYAVWLPDETMLRDDVQAIARDEGLSELEVAALLGRLSSSLKFSGTLAVRRACGREPSLRRAVRAVRRRLKELSRQEDVGGDSS